MFDLSIRGKRGNAAQVYPTMYTGFVPNVVAVTRNSRLNVHWTGSRRNNAGNSGRGDDDFTAQPDDPKKIDFHGLAHSSPNSCISRHTDFSEVNISSRRSLLTDVNDSCHVTDWQHGYNWVPIDLPVQIVSHDSILVNPQASTSPFTLPNNDIKDISIKFDSDTTYQIVVQEMMESEFSNLYPVAFEHLNLPSDQFDQQYFKVSPTNTDLPMTVTISIKAVLYIWCDLKQHWSMLHKRGSDVVQFTNTKSGLIVISRHINYNFLLNFFLIFTALVILAGGSLLYFRQQPREWDNLKRGFNEFVLRRPA